MGKINEILERNPIIPTIKNEEGLKNVIECESEVVFILTSNLFNIKGMIDELKKRKIPLTIVGDVNSTSVSEHTMMLIVSVFKKIILADFSTRNSFWDYRNNYEPRELYSKNLLIVGFGRIGKKLGRLANAFGMNIFVYDPYINNNFEEYEIQYFQDLKTAFQSADCISLNLPKVEKPIITRENSKYLKHGVIIVNTARGGLIEDNVLLDGIQKGTIAGVGLDVFDNEPLEKNHLKIKLIQI